MDDITINQNGPEGNANERVLHTYRASELDAHLSHTKIHLLFWRDGVPFCGVCNRRDLGRLNEN